ncbi:MAG: hypothetical protein M3247_00675 [Thermoproteota archaeon]|nr:hypothetical protein [Thermoproteota archaeon]
MANQRANFIQERFSGHDGAAFPIGLDSLWSLGLLLSIRVQMSISSCCCAQMLAASSRI